MRDNAAIGHQLQQQGAQPANLPGGLVSSLFSMPATSVLSTPATTFPPSIHQGAGSYGVGAAGAPPSGFPLTGGTQYTPVVTPYQLAPQQSGMLAIPGFQGPSPTTFPPS